MALNTEPGAALADSLCTVAQADAFHAARGNTLWAPLTTPEKEQALRRATDYMAVYSSRWKGARTSSTQALDWPRYGVVVHGYDLASDVIPLPVANACAELAFRGAKGDLAPDLGPQVTEKTVGPITVRYAQGARQSAAFQAVENLLRAYLGGGTSMIRVVRA